jgi:hypothetical protein
MLEPGPGADQSEQGKREPDEHGVGAVHQPVRERCEHHGNGVRIDERAHALDDRRRDGDHQPGDERQNPSGCEQHRHEQDERQAVVVEDDLQRRMQQIREQHADHDQRRPPERDRGPPSAAPAGRGRIRTPGEEPERDARHRREQDRGAAVVEVLAAVEDDVRGEHAEQGEAPCQVRSEDATRFEAPPVQLRAPVRSRR